LEKSAPAIRRATGDLFAKVVASAFSQRRKMLRNTLREFFGEDALAALGIAPTARAEDIAVADYVRLANALAERGPPLSSSGRPQRIAVIGGGPAGLMAAEVLAGAGLRSRCL
jgi:NADPH-dependent 2,4-dienoyl-CoA reductase/sulfur reductase-like enzyme